MTEPAAVIPDEKSLTDELVEKTPWWSVSTGIHVVLLLILVYTVSMGSERKRERIVEVTIKEREIVEDKPPELETPKPSVDPDSTVEEPTVLKNNSDEPDETDVEVDFSEPKGESIDFRSNKPFRGPSTYDSMGPQGGGGGAYGDRGGNNKGGKGNHPGASPETEDAVLWALMWLSRHQNQDGSWNVKSYTQHCGKMLPDNKTQYSGRCEPNPGMDEFDVGVTGLAILAFLGAGHTHLSKEKYDGISFGDVVKRGVKYLMEHQDPEGGIGTGDTNPDAKIMYNHTICALALSEAYGMTGSPLFKDAAQRAVDYTVSAQNAGKGWRYKPRKGDNDSSVTGWAVMVLKSAELSGLSFPRTAYDGARAWFTEVSEPAYYRTGYTFRNSAKVYAPGKNEDFNHHEALTAIAVMCKIFMDKDKNDPALAGGCGWLVKDLPVVDWSKDKNNVDYYYWYYASLALFQFDGPKGKYWSMWNEKMKEALVKNQNLKDKGDKFGSWETEERWSCEGGRVYATAMNALTLEVYYRYANVFGTK